jgi:NTE family protein
VASGPADQGSSGHRPVDLALGGGGVRGVALVGALRELDDAGYRAVRVLGSSAGAVVGAFVTALLAAGEPVSRLSELMDAFEPRRLAEPTMLDRLPLVGEPLSLLVDHAIYRGRYLRSFVTEQLTALGVRTFADLALPTSGPEAGQAADLAPSQRFRLAVTVTDLTLRREAVLPWDLPQYGIEPDSFAVADAVVASAAIPFLFPSSRITAGDGTSVVVDGGVMDNLPIGTLDATTPRPPPWPTWAISVGGLLPPSRRSPANPVAEAIALVETLIAGGEARHVADPCTADRIIAIAASGVSPLDFDLSTAQRDTLIAAGRASASRFLARWDFDAWLSRCGRQPAVRILPDS